MHNKPHTEEAKRKMSLTKKGKHYSPSTEFKKGDRGHWQGGVSEHNGYIMIFSPDHPNKDKNGYYRKHRLIMEKHLGRYLDKQEVVHHIDGDKKNNHLSNLLLLPNESEHKKLHKDVGMSTRFKKGRKNATSSNK